LAQGYRGAGSGAGNQLDMGIGNPLHLLFVAVVALVVLGPKRLPELARALGKGMREFRQALDDGGATLPPASDRELSMAGSEPVSPALDPGADLAPLTGVAAVNEPVEPRAEPRYPPAA
jgi:sec-independent protein translocase protein TatB